MLSFDTGVASLPPFSVAVPIVGAAILLAGGRVLPRWVVDAVATLVALGVTALSAIVLAHAASGPVVTWVARWVPVRGFSVGIVLLSDPVGEGIAVLAGALTTIALIYSWRYFQSGEAHYQALVLLFLAGMQGFSLTGDLFDMFVFFELMGVAAYALTGMKVEDPTAVEGSLNFGVINSLGAYLSLTGIALLYARTGNLGLPQLGRALSHDHLSALIVAAFVLVLAGFLVKAAMVPFHFWLADAHAVAPAPICVLFSGVMVPLGVYAAPGLLGGFLTAHRPERCPACLSHRRGRHCRGGDDDVSRATAHQAAARVFDHRPCGSFYLRAGAAQRVGNQWGAALRRRPRRSQVGAVPARGDPAQPVRVGG